MDIGWAVDVNEGGDAIVTGEFVGTVNFGGTDLVSAGSTDIFPTKLSDRIDHFELSYPDAGVAEFRIRDDSQDFIEPEVVKVSDVMITDDDIEEYVAFTQPGNIVEDPTDVNNIAFGAGLAAFSTSLPTPASLPLVSYMRGAAGGFLVDPTVTVAPYKDTAALGVSPPPNFKIIYGALPLDAPYLYCNGYDVTIPRQAPTPPPSVLIITQAFDDAFLSEFGEGNIPLQHWKGSAWEILPPTVSTAVNIIWAIATNVSQLSPVFVTAPPAARVSWSASRRGSFAAPSRAAA